ncbi:unnamed protein product [Adineta ricciae]|uniref:Methyltransferase FkbM domain-containing protein n=1 Tax=Adineta ricciae TaxID=249248 RepID=A0A815B6Q8_ADIRI|nr:unnamed protein product [Adineta ricciae]CAF1535852.1 unnamed protein product [Adineta ricciae]
MAQTINFNPNCSKLFRTLIIIVTSLSLGFYLASFERVEKVQKLSSSSINIVDTTQPLTTNITCVKTKKLFDLYHSTICVHDYEDYVSEIVRKDHIWEEDYIVRILQILIRNPSLDMIDIGGNIGTYTMFTAGALGRFTLTIECFKPNVERIIRAVQIENVHNRVVIVHRALYSKSGEYIQLSQESPSGLQIKNAISKNSQDDYIVQTVQLDDLLPILIQRNVRAAIIKIDIEGSEVYLLESGRKVFQQIDIQLVMMEWGNGLRKTYADRYEKIVNYFEELHYITTDVDCNILDVTDWRTTWPGSVYWIKEIHFKKSIC